MLLTIAIFGILSIVGTSMLAATSANYRMRIAENNKVKNLYSAESGIDLAYIKLTEEVKKAIEAGIASRETFKSTYIEYLEDNLGNNVSDSYKLSNGGSADVICTVEPGEGEGKRATLESTYEVDGKSRVVSVSYNIGIPENYSEMNGNINIGRVGKYSLATDGDLKIINDDGQRAEISILGDVWVNGNKNSIDKIYEDPVSNKYDGGITLRNNKTKFEGNIYTAANIRLNKAELFTNTAEDKNNIFAENILMGNIGEGENEGQVSLMGDNGNIYLANDFVISCNDAIASMKNLYAFNDARITLQDKEIRGSSSLIVNSTNWGTEAGSFTVKDNAYIMGSAYIKGSKYDENNKNENYQTGESVAIKGNYEAYTGSPEDYSTDANSYDYEDLGYVYIDPLQLINSIDGEELSVIEKAELFKTYSDKHEGLRKTGIYLPSNEDDNSDTNTYTLGAFISGGNINKGGYNLEETENVQRLKEIFVKSVYYMGENVTTAEVESQFNQGRPSFFVRNQINWTNIEGLLAQIGAGAKYYTTTTNNMKVIISYKNEKLDGENQIVVKNGKIIAAGGKEVSIDKDVEYLIITDGAVMVDSMDGFKGKILSVGDITIKNSSNDIGSNIILGSSIGKDSVNNISIQGLISKEKWSLIK